MGILLGCCDSFPGFPMADPALICTCHTRKLAGSIVPEEVTLHATQQGLGTGTQPAVVDLPGHQPSAQSCQSPPHISITLQAAVGAHSQQPSPKQQA